jgi:hypothetical protein
MVVLGSFTPAQIALANLIVKVVYTGKAIVSGAVQTEENAENGELFWVAVN